MVMAVWIYMVVGLQREMAIDNFSTKPRTLK